MHPRTDSRILTPDYYINLARVLDRGGFDLLFFDDRLAMPTAYGNSTDQSVRYGSRAVKLDILTILALVASHTSRIGLGATYSTSYYAPFHVARAFSTLDHLSRGRAVWNIVTSLNRNEAENFGVEYQDSEARYDRADEFLEIVTALWESWERDAMVVDRESGIYADPRKVHEINYAGKWLSARGPLTVPQPPQGWPVLLQAGQSGRGTSFAARWADLIFTAPRNKEAAVKHYAGQFDLVEAAGRQRSQVKVIPALPVVVAEDADTAQARVRYWDSLASPEEEVIVLSELASFDFARLDMDKPLPDDLLEQIPGAKGLFTSYLERARLKFGPDATLRELIRSQMQNDRRVVGDPMQVADYLCDWFLDRACDGFAITPADTPGSFEDFARLVIPELRRRGFAPELEEAPDLRSRLGLPERASR